MFTEVDCVGELNSSYIYGNIRSILRDLRNVVSDDSVDELISSELFRSIRSVVLHHESYK